MINNLNNLINLLSFKDSHKKKFLELEVKNKFTN